MEMKKLQLSKNLKKNNTHISAYKYSFKELFSSELKMLPSPNQRTLEKTNKPTNKHRYQRWEAKAKREQYV